MDWEMVCRPDGQCKDHITAETVGAKATSQSLADDRSGWQVRIDKKQKRRRTVLVTY